MYQAADFLLVGKCSARKPSLPLHAGPCYRCLFPEAPQAASCARCSDAGVLGVVPGIIGCLQALETIKLASGVRLLPILRDAQCVN